MSEEGGGKIKAKKSYSQPKPYERRKSLFGKVTDTIKEVIAPSWLSDLVKSVKRTSPQDDEDEYVEQQSQEIKNPLQSQNTMRSRFQRAGPSHSLPPQLIPLSSNGIPTFTPQSKSSEKPSCAWSQTPQTEIAQSLTGKNDTASVGNCTTERPKLHHLPKPSQSSYGGLGGLPQDDAEETIDNEVLQNCTQDISQSDLETSNLEKASTFTETYNSRRNKPSRSRPGFDISLFGSPLSNNFLSKSFHESSFYPGKTMYGGASANRSSSRLNVTAPYQTSFPVRQKMKVKPASTSGSATTSATAQMILDTLEKMSTPLSDAKKIPIGDSAMKMSTSHFTPGSYRRMSRSGIGTYLDTRRELQDPGKGPPKNRLSLSTSASISKNYQKFSLSQVDYKPKETTSKDASPLVSENMTNFPGSSGTGGGKVKSKKFQQHIPGRKGQEEDDEEVEIPNLKTDFTLPVKVMPNFDFNGDGVLSRAKTVILDSEKRKSELTSDTPYTFASPIQKTPTKAGQESKSTKLNFTFSQPIDVDGTSSVKAKSVTFDIEPQNKEGFSSPPGFRFGIPMNNMSTPALGASPVLPSSKIKTTSELKVGSVMDVLGKSDRSGENNFKGFQPANQLKEGSVMDILGKSSGTSNNLKPAFELKSGSVMDILSKGSSDSSSGFKPAVQTGKKEAEKPESTTQPSLSSMFRPAPGSWKCDTCMIINKADVTKCVACETHKPGGSSNSKTKETGQPSLSSMFKPDAGSWKCDVCLINNKADVVKCVACQANKPGKLNNGSSSGKPSLSSMFKTDAGSWNCDVCLVNNKAEVMKCVACQANKPGTGKSNNSSTGQPSLSSMFKPDAGSWKCDVCLINNKADVVKCVACQANKPGQSNTAAEKPKLSSIFKTEAGSWNCDTCLVNNKADDLKCVACQANKPGAAPKKAEDNSLASMFKKPVGSWDCDTCLVPNKAEATKCIACETPRPGLQPSSFASGFKFGTGSSFSGQKGFVFGNVENNSDFSDKSKEQGSDDKKLTSGFVLGNVSKTDTGVSKTTGGFTLGSTTVSGSAVASVGGFQFGTSSTGSSVSTTSGSLLLGTATNTTGTPSTGGFQFGTITSASSAASSTSGFQFSKDKSVDTTVKTSADNTNSKPSPATGFSFGVKDTTDSNKPSEGGFKFGASEGVKSNTIQSTGGFKIGIQESSAPQFGNSSSKTISIVDSSEGKAETLEASASMFKTIFGVDKAEMQVLTPSGNPATSSQPSSSVFGSGAGFTFGTVPTQAPVALGTTVGGIKQSSTGNINSTEAKQPTLHFQSTSSNTSLKRTLDTENGPSDAKKSSFTVNASVQSADTGSPFKFNTAANVTTSSTPSGTVTSVPNPGGFNFGLTSSTTANLVSGFNSNTNNATANFSFGGTNNTEKSKSTAFNAGAPLLFGNPTASTTTAPVPAANTFVFGDNTTSTASNFTFTARPSTNPASAAASPFGAAQNNGSASVFGNANTNFGNPAGPTIPFGGSSVPSFGSPAPSGLGTGSTPAPFGGSAAATPAFGAAPVTSASGFNQPSFNFGPSAAAPAANGPPVFQFGVKAPENAIPAHPQGGATGGFNFGQSQSVPSGATFNFTATTPNNNPFGGQNTAQSMSGPGSFTIGSTGNADQGRKIKRAVRKIRR